MRRPCSFVRSRGQPGSAGAPAALGLDLAARLPVASVLMASRSVIVVFILESEFELFFLNLLPATPSATAAVDTLLALKVASARRRARQIFHGCSDWQHHSCRHLDQ